MKKEVAGEHSDREREVFEQALAVEPQKRAAVVRHACGGDEQLERRVERLLAAHDRAEDRPESVARVVEPEVPPEWIGPYRIVEPIGSGGMGVVYLAEQTEPLRRRVALKLIRGGFDTPEVVTRFHSERQTLALMDHPNIARIYDSGTAESGRPYIVMEYVAGEPLVRYCDRVRANLRRRLELFVQVCRAVQHAHQKGIIHRDLKPSNILVSEVDGRPVPRVIDFGVAKVLEDGIPEADGLTRDGRMVGTPAYMSPEQVGAAGIDIDTRSDVYSLGVVLYELLAGSLPFDARDFDHGPIGELQRVIREVDPPRPSLRLVGNGAADTQVAEQRATGLRRLASELRGELDWVVMKALAKERDRRYETAESLAQDVERYLADEPVTANPPSRTYVARKFVARHRVAVIGAALALAALVLGGVGTTIGLLRAREQRDLVAERNVQLEAVAAFQADILRRIDPRFAGQQLVADLLVRFADSLAPDADGRDEARAAFEDGLARINATDAAVAMMEHTIFRPAIASIGERFVDQPVVAAELYFGLGEAYFALGRWEPALDLVEQALGLRREHLGPNDKLTLVTLGSLGVLRMRVGDFEGAEPVYREAYSRMREHLGEEHEETLATMNNMGALYEQLEQYEEAERYYAQALEISSRTLGPDHQSTIERANNVASVVMIQGRMEEARELFEDVLAASLAQLGEDHPTTTTARNNLGSLLRLTDRTVEALPYLRDALESSRRTVGELHPHTLIALGNLGTAHLDVGEVEETERLYTLALDGFRETLGPRHPDTITMVCTVADFELERGELEAAHELCDTALEATQGELVGYRRIEEGYLLERRGLASGNLGDFEASEADLLGAYSIFEQERGAGSPLAGYTAQALVSLYEVWNEKKPGAGHDQSAEQWRTRQ